MTAKDKVLLHYPDAELCLWLDRYHIEAGVTKFPSALTIAEAWLYALNEIKSSMSAMTFGD